MEDVNQFTDLKLQYSSNRSDADIQIFYDKKIDLYNYPDLLGLTTYNQIDKKRIWEIFINKSEINSDNQLFYTMLHEIGHTLGLEHPHDDTDGDYYKSKSIVSSATSSQTVMSSRKPDYSFYPGKFQANDIQALTRIWGEDLRFKVNNFIDDLIQPSVNSRNSIINLPIDMTRNFFVNGNGSPDGLIKAKINTWRVNFNFHSV